VSYWGKTIGAFSGYLIGGVFGALLGLLLGHLLDKGMHNKAPLQFTRMSVTELEQIKSEFFTATFTVMGHVAKTEGLSPEDEILFAKHVMDRMGLPDERRRDALRLFNEGKQPGFPLETVIGQFYIACKDQPNLLEMFVEIQLYAAFYSGKINALARQIILNISYQLDLTNADFDRFEKLVKAEYHVGNGKKTAELRNKDVGLEDAYAILNTTPNASNDEVKTAYRRLTSKHHPDKLAAKGLPEDMLKLAEARTWEIRAAYERIREVRDF
jgi:DnaJ like chaperone protein